MSKIKHIFTLTFGQGINTLINLLFLPYLARSLSYTEYGSYGQTLLVVDVSRTLLLLGLSQIIYVWLSQNKIERNSVISNNYVAAFFSGLLGLVFFSISYDWFSALFNNPQLSKLILIYSLSLPFYILYVSQNAVLIFDKRVKESISIVIGSNLLKVFLVLISIQIFKSLEWVMWSLVIAAFVQWLWSYILTSAFFNFKTIKSIIWFGQVKQGFLLGLTGVVGIAFLSTDGFMISHLMSIKEYAIYRNGAIEVPFIATIYGSIAAIVMPEVSRLLADNQNRKVVELKRKVISNTAMLVYPIMIFLIVFNQSFISLYLGDKYIASGSIFAVYTLSLIIRINDYSDVLISYQKTKIILISYVTAFILNIILNYVLITQVGVIGAPIATMFSLMVLAILQLLPTLKLLDTSLFKFIDFVSIFKMITLSILLVSTLYLGNIFFDGKLVLIISIIIYFPILYSLLLYKKLLDRNILVGIFPKQILKIVSKWV